MRAKNIYIIVSLLLLISIGCKKDFLETNPTDQVSDAIVFTTPEGAEAALNGIYRFMYSYNTDVDAESHEDFGQKAVDLQNDLMGEDIVMSIFHWFGFNYAYRVNALGQDYARPRIRWGFYYKIINNSNIIITNIDNINASDEFKNSIKGQALALRAYCYYNLVMSFSKTIVGNETAPGVPVYTEPATYGKGRGTVQQVYNQIVKDLDDAISLLATATERPNKSWINLSVAQGIYARVALTMNNWTKAQTLANSARNGLELMSSSDFAAGFNDFTNPEWMWGFDVNAEQATVYASFFSHMANNIDGYAGGLGVYKNISKELYDNMLDIDVRKSLFENYSDTVPVKGFQNKFRDNGNADWTDDYVMMRVAEMYLIEAEAAARNTQEAVAKTLLTALRSKRYSGTVNDSPNTGVALIDEILLERRIELWGEGFSLFDMKRLKKGLNRGTSHKQSVCRIYTIPAESNSFEFQIPIIELDANDSIPSSSQNPNPVP